ncbi:MAG: lycopene cyclase domain-containing protein [Candidatus Odinarchaeota archaeon]
MNYAGILGYFVSVPLIILSIIYAISSYRGKSAGNDSIKKELLALLAMVLIAFIYTTPWDNYLVATGVWWYDVTKIIGTIGWVPIEEYSFFILQTLLTGVFFLWIRSNDRFKTADYTPKNKFLRIGSFTAVFVQWLVAVILFLSGENLFTYLALILSWALIPVMLQLLIGADIIWKHRLSVLTAIIIPSVYLAVVDALAIADGIWTISTGTSTGLLLGGVLPVEEAVFFFVTNVLVVFGLTLVLDENSMKRVRMHFMNKGENRLK